MVKKIFTLIAIFGFFAVSIQFALAYKNPGNPTGYVDDYAKLLSTTEKNDLENKLVDFEKNTGNEIAVVTVPSLEGDTIENFAVKLFQDWQIGVKGKDNGVLLLIARDEHKIRIEVGYGLEPVLTDAEASSIIRNIITPAFKQNDFAGGIDSATDAMIATIGGDTSAIPKDSKFSVKAIFPVLFFCFFIFLWIASVLSRSKSWWAGGLVGAFIAVLVTGFFGLIYIGLISFILLIPLGLFFDFVVSRGYQNSKSSGTAPPWWTGGGFGGGSSGGGFGGFGGGGSGGGGASGGW